MERWVQRLGEEGVFCRRVNVDYASHSAEMDPILSELASGLSEPGAAGGAGADGVDGDGSALRGDSAGRNILVPEPAADGALDLALRS